MAKESYGTFFSETRIPYDPLWEGPLKKTRQCTDRLWLIIFAGFLITWVTIVTYAFSNGSIDRLIVPTDSDGRNCGIDPDVLDKPNLIFFDLTKCINGACDTTQVCRATCPAENFLYQSKVGALADVKKKLICKSHINVDLIQTWEQADYYIEQDLCAKYYLKSEPIIKRCIPTGPVPAEFNSIISTDQLNNATQIIHQLTALEKNLEDAFGDIAAVRYEILGFIALSGLVALSYIVLLRWFAKSFVYATILIICAFLGFFIYQYSMNLSQNTDGNATYALIFCIVLLAMVILTTIILRHRINLACQIIKESSKAVTCIWSSLLFPIVTWTLHIIIITVAISALFYLHTISKPNYQIHLQEMIPNTCICSSLVSFPNNATCDPEVFKTECHDINDNGPCTTATCSLTGNTAPDQIYLYHFINLMALLWLTLIVSGFGHMVLASSFATWYWTFNKQNIPDFTLVRSFWITSRYHLGTVAFGSLIIWICDVIRFILSPVLGPMQPDSPVTMQPMGWFNGIFDLFTSFLQYLNRNAYTMCAIHGKNFCRSAKEAFNLIMRNVVRVVVVTNITEWLLTIAKIFIVLLIAGLTAGYYSHYEPNAVKNLQVPVMMALLGSYVLSSVFFSVHKTAVDTLFLCFLEDSERNDGSQERPHYMSMKLKQLLQK